MVLKVKCQHFTHCLGSTFQAHSKLNTLCWVWVFTTDGGFWHQSLLDLVAALQISSSSLKLIHYQKAGVCLMHFSSLSKLLKQSSNKHLKMEVHKYQTEFQQSGG